MGSSGIDEHISRKSWKTREQYGNIQGNQIVLHLYVHRVIFTKVFLAKR